MGAWEHPVRTGHILLLYGALPGTSCVAIREYVRVANLEIIAKVLEPSGRQNRVFSLPMGRH